MLFHIFRSYTNIPTQNPAEAKVQGSKITDPSETPLGIWYNNIPQLVKYF